MNQKTQQGATVPNHQEVQDPCIRNQGGKLRVPPLS